MGSPWGVPHHIRDVNDDGVRRRAPFRLKDARDRRGVQRVGAEAVDGFGRERNQPARAEHGSGSRARVSLRLPGIDFQDDRFQGAASFSPVWYNTMLRSSPASTARPTRGEAPAMPEQPPVGTAPAPPAEQRRIALESFNKAKELIAEGGHDYAIQL